MRPSLEKAAAAEAASAWAEAGVAVVAAGLLPGGAAWAAEAGEVQEMRREVAQMRGQVQALLSAVTEATELERQRSASLSRAIKEMASAAPAPAASAHECAGRPGRGSRQ